MRKGMIALATLVATTMMAAPAFADGEGITIFNSKMEI